jgi:holo-[acyl-carrier protein] synthase
VIIGLGIDVVALAAFRPRLDDALIADLFLPGEVAYVSTQARPWQHYAARFAAKEACMKALGHGLEDGLRFRDIEIVRAPNGAVDLRLSGRAREVAQERRVARAHVSLTHTADSAAATVVLEGEPSPSAATPPHMQEAR